MRKIIALFIALFMVVFSFSAYASGFSDMPEKNSPYFEALEYGVNNNIISGINGKILPQNPVTRAEAITFICRAGGFNVAGDNLSGIKDVAASDWFYSFVAKAVASKAVSPDANGMIYPSETLSRRAAWDLLYKAFGANAAYSPISDGASTATRGEFILWLYNYVKTNKVEMPTASTGTALPTESGTELSEYSQLEAQKALEAMQLALGLRADGTTYTNITAFKDFSQTGWGSGMGGSSSSTPSRPTSPSKEDDTESSSEEETTDSNEGMTPVPTETETESPTFGDIDNKNDNIGEDIWDDGWRPDGSTESDKFDEEDGNFEFDDIVIVPTEPTSETNTEPETGPSTGSTEPDTEPETEPDTEPDTKPDTEFETSDNMTNPETPSEPESEPESPSEDESLPTESDSNPTEEDTTDDEEPSNDDTTESEDNDVSNPDEEPSEEPGEVPLPPSSSEQPEGESEFAALTWLFSKDWWFD